MLTAAELARYGRQLVLPEVGLSGQERLHRASVLIVGAGGLGSPVALYLAAAGVGTIGLVDNDVVEIGNLHRQILHGTEDVGRDKTASASESLTRLNPHVRINTHQERLTAPRAVALLSEYDIVVDGSDNYSTRYAVNDACVELGKTWIYGSVERFSGQVSVFGAPDGPCYRCVFPEAPAPGSTSSCEEIGVLGAVPGAVGSIQAVEALKCLLGIGAPLVGRLWQLDFKTGEVRVVRFERRPDCSACGAAVRAPVSLVQHEDEDVDIEPSELAQRLQATDSVQVLDIREPWEWSVSRIRDSRVTLLPLGDLESRVDAIDRRRDLVVYCHHGARSSMAAHWLRTKGFRARSLAGGIDRWSREIDSSVPRY
ncbi:MAG TPA: HesA/MoeB/ThiF family protein [Gemmatimonadaceae bacterium]|nr:HesA/MoeB/ThiF family protein [Gemmatimonadaceae bacterium]